MHDDDLVFVKQIRDAEKYFPVSRDQIVSALDMNGCFESKCDHYTNGDGPFGLRLNVYARSRFSTSWTASLKLNNQRIDCIDHENWFWTVDGRGGELASGWHRHEWDEERQTSDPLKRPLVGFDGGGLEIRDFVIRAMSEFRVVLDRR